MVMVTKRSLVTMVMVTKRCLAAGNTKAITEVTHYSQWSNKPATTHTHIRTEIH